MDSFSKNQHAKCLPKLSTCKAISRRDSLSSSRTRDSGYNSDLDSLSPLDAFGPEHDIFLPSLPPVPDVQINNTRPLASSRAVLLGFQSSKTTCVTSAGPIRESTTTLEHVARFPYPSTVPVPTQHLVKNCAAQDAEIEHWIKQNLPPRQKEQERISSIASLSSSSSCDMYSNTDVSGDEADISDSNATLPLPRITLKVIELILRKVEVQLAIAAWRQCVQGSSSSNGRSEYARGRSSNNTSSSSIHGQKRKSRLEGSLPPDGLDGDESNKRRRGSAVTTDDSELGVRFACPFFKHDPDRYRNRRTCPGPGWTTVHRMKEHLYRSHSQPIFCPICYSIFKSDREQLDHVRLQSCQRSEPQQMEGIDRETIWTLRKRTTALRLEEDKWRDAYHILFPEVAIPDIPSPFYDCDAPSETSRRFRLELLRRVQNELFATANHVPNPVEQQLLHRVASIIRRCEDDILNPHASPALVPLTTDRRPSTVSTISTISEHVAPLPVPTSCSNSSAAPQGNEWNMDYCSADAARDVPEVVESMVDFNPVVWLDPADNVFSLGIDWEGIFPPGSHNHMLGS